MVPWNLLLEFALGTGGRRLRSKGSSYGSEKSIRSRIWVGKLPRRAKLTASLFTTPYFCLKSNIRCVTMSPIFAKACLNSCAEAVLTVTDIVADKQVQVFGYFSKRI